MFARSINDTSRVIRMTIVGDATTWNVILTTLESSFTVVMCFKYRPPTYTAVAVSAIVKHTSLPRQIVDYTSKSFTG